jgi:hypothetical protein
MIFELVAGNTHNSGASRYSLFSFAFRPLGAQTLSGHV